ncbi:hypothetical protein IMSAG049_00293 [Clostridiales bacterium]|nr:hypothetical protein IMSAG049_00293 [Clostridiales bacterium]
MSIAFSENERKIILEKLKKGAKIFSAEKGMKKTSVDKLVVYAGISKGAFYNFFRSKDELFLEILEDWHTKIYGDALDCLMEKSNATMKNKAGRAILQACETMHKESVMKFIREDLEQLLENISGTELMERYHSDDIHIDEVIRFSEIKLLVTNREAADIVKNLVFTVLNSEMNGYWHAQKIMINSVCSFIIK